jgi:hypothetical protein
MIKSVRMVLIMCVSALYVTGCATCQSSFGMNGLPKEQYRVGGGLQIEYEIPADGVCYLVDVNTGKFLITETHSEGDSLSFHCLKAIAINKRI